MADNNSNEVEDQEDLTVRGVSTPTKKRRVRNELPPNKRDVKKYFRKEWLQETKFKGWLKEVCGDNTKAKCIACGVTLNCGKSELIKHNNGKNHAKKVRSLNNQSCLSSFLDSQKTEREKNRIHEERVKNAEIKLSLFFAEHNVAVHVVDHLVPLLQEIFLDSSTLKDVQLHRTKCTTIVTNVIGKSIQSNLINTLKNVRTLIFT